MFAFYVNLITEFYEIKKTKCLYNSNTAIVFQ